MLITNDARERLLMETHPADSMHGDVARGGETLPCDEGLPGSQTAKTEPRDGFPGDRRHGRRRQARP